MLGQELLGQMILAQNTSEQEIPYPTWDIQCKSTEPVWDIVRKEQSNLRQCNKN